ncbi:MAG: phosphonate ABC transporter, permease protein PhnE [Chthonomonadales bacterium]|nr:phosphonate ABC transporter, permease protein PhnE [Chthonomonadales bacterium]
MSGRARRNLGRAVVALVIAGVVWWALRGSEFDAARLTEGLGRARQYLGQMFPPDWSVLGKAGRAVVVTLQMAIVGTVLGAAGALPVSFLAARTPALPRAFSSAVKTLLNVLRAVPPLIYALLFVYMVGLGPFPGALGIAVGSFVMLAKLFAEALESVHPAPVEAVKAVGGDPAQVFAYGMLPQALPLFVSQTLYAWELNIGAATILGVVGAGGIGFELVAAINYFQWPQVCTYVLVLVAMVLVADAVSYHLRKRYT